MPLRIFLLGFVFLVACPIQAQVNPGRLSVAPSSVTNVPSATPTQPPAAKAPEPISNMVDAPLPEIANQPKVIIPSQTSGADGPKGPRDGHWYIGGGAGATTSVGNPPLDQTDSGNLGFYAAAKVGYDFAVRDVQLAFGGPTPMRTAMELEGSYLGTYEKIPLQNGGQGVGTESYNLAAYAVMLNGLIKFEDLPVTPYFGGGVGAAVLYSNNHKITDSAGDAITTTTSANNVCLALQAIVGLERNIYENLSVFIEYKFLAYMDVQFSYGSETSANGSPGGSNSSNNFMAQQIISSGLKWSF
jgi:opacity protein-like surface antigen